MVALDLRSIDILWVSCLFLINRTKRCRLYFRLEGIYTPCPIGTEPLKISVRSKNPEYFQIFISYSVTHMYLTILLLLNRSDWHYIQGLFSITMQGEFLEIQDLTKVTDKLLIIEIFLTLRKRYVTSEWNTCRYSSFTIIKYVHIWYKKLKFINTSHISAQTITIWCHPKSRIRTNVHTWY